MTSSATPAARLTSFEISRPELLRGTDVSVLLGGYGKRLGSSPSSPLDYEECVPVDKLDMFLSYSRHSSALAKLIALKFYFHGWPAFFAGALAGVCTWAIWRWVRMHQFGACAGNSGLFWQISTNGPCFGLLFVTSVSDLAVSGSWQRWTPLCLSVGTAAFFLTFCAWGLVARCCLPRRSIFRGTVCIHQTDPVIKGDGINSLGAVLAQTQVLVMAWDNTYFTRLWCVYEISAFRAASPHSRVDFIPVELGAFMAVILAGSAVGLCAMGFLSTHGYREFMLWRVVIPIDEVIHLREWQWLAVTLYAVPIAFSSLVVMLVFRNIRTYLCFRANLDADLSAFSVKRARCFCCDCGHVHPATGERVQCDREAIYKSIRRWYRGSVSEFEASIRGDFKDGVDRMLGPLLPYSYAVCIGLPYFLAWLDFALCCPEYVLLLGLVRLLLRAPLDVFLFLSICRLLKCIAPEMLGRCCYAVVLPACSILVVSSVAMLEFAVDWVLKQCRYSVVAWLTITLVELGLVCGAYAHTRPLNALASRWRLLSSRPSPTSRQTSAAAELELPGAPAARRSP